MQTIKRRRLTPLKIQRIYKLNRDGISQVSIAETLGINVAQVWYHLHKLRNAPAPAIENVESQVESQPVKSTEVKDLITKIIGSHVLKPEHKVHLMEILVNQL